ncbi:MAG: hypothetical protein HY322_04510 [Betaproteobacteria bacterium]|nr:hypothetical protein [Betaproteobacteria bacterium]
MSSPVVFSLTAAQFRVLQCLADGRSDDMPERALRQLVIKRLVSDGAGWGLTPAGEAAALLVARLCEASPVFGESAASPNRGLPGPESAPLGIYAKSVHRKEQKPYQSAAKGRNHPRLSRLAHGLLQSGGYLSDPKPASQVIDELTPEDWNLVVAHHAQQDVLRQAESSGKAGVRMLLAQLRASAHGVSEHGD